MTSTEQAVADAMSRHGRQLPVEEITADWAMSQDAGIDGIDVDDFVMDLEARFGSIVSDIPWGRFSDQRASFRGCAVWFAPLWLVWRLFRWPFDGYWVPPPNGGEERLTVKHLATVLDAGEWIEPTDSKL
jgi:hypothetical protein